METALVAVPRTTHLGTLQRLAIITKVITKANKTPFFSSPKVPKPRGRSSSPAFCLRACDTSTRLDALGCYNCAPSRATNSSRTLAAIDITLAPAIDHRSLRLLEDLRCVYVFVLRKRWVPWWDLSVDVYVFFPPPHNFNVIISPCHMSCETRDAERYCVMIWAFSVRRDQNGASHSLYSCAVTGWRTMRQAPS